MPSSYPDYPQGPDLQGFLEPVAAACRITLPTSIDYQQRIDQARQTFEQQIGRVLLATSQTRRFDPPTNVRGIVDLRTDLVSVTSLTVQGAAKVEGTDYLLEPYNSAQDGKPYRWIEFLSGIYWRFPLYVELRRSVVIVGMFGYALGVPTLGYDAILAQGAIDCYPDLALAISRGLQMKRQGDTEEMYARGKGNGPLFEEMISWQARVAQSINNLTPAEVGL